MPELCPCCSGLQYSACCQPYIGNTRTAAEPETLMRSRYTAYVKHDVDYFRHLASRFASGEMA
ncbi:SEC-C motif-containing protein [Brenneria salicis ATCC 15712 = DSM 30166]|uniref:SEC-C motif-containing protein n=1 Tax=Brenneria salicis ATCC 15712 = DSM 30166 TaxID=714314 RepID=A0A366I2L9_9GAMM|nr:SEC-C motif-containing protein [Brenneria salicis ATCC 15712 = DSM 30166]